MKEGDIISGTLELGRNLTLAVAVKAAGLTIAQAEFMHFGNVAKFSIAACSIIAGMLLLTFAAARFLDVSFPDGYAQSRPKRILLTLVLTAVFGTCATFVLDAVSKTVSHSRAVRICNNPRFAEDEIIQGSKECIEVRKAEESERKDFHDRHERRSRRD